MTTPMEPPINLDADRTDRDDAFSRKPFAATIAKALSRDPGDAPLVFGIEGEWGSGKTHLLGQIREILTNVHPETVIVDFNPWLISNTESLVLAMLGQLAAQIGTLSTDGKTQVRNGLVVSKRLLGYLSALQRVAEPASLLFDPSGMTSGAISVARAPLDRMRKFLDDIEMPNRLDKSDVLGQRRKVEEALKEFGKPIIVIVDDLDRLRDDQIRSMFQAIKAVADFPGTTYLLAYDPKRVAKAFDEPDFVEKIVQIAYPIPHLHPWNKALFVEQQIASTLKAIGIEENLSGPELFGQALRISARLCRHPRDVVRLCNRLRLALPPVVGSINHADIIVAEALALSCPPVFEAIRRHSSDFTANIHPLEDSEAEEAFVHYLAEIESEDSNEPSWLKHIPNTINNKDAVVRALKFLFTERPETLTLPKTARERRLRVPELLAEYVQLNAVEGVPSPAAIDHLLSDPENIEEKLTDGNGDVVAMLGWIHKYFPTQELSNPDVILRQFISLSDRQEIRGQGKALGLLGDIALDLIKGSNPSARPNLMERLVRDAPLGLSMTAVRTMAKETGKILLNRRSPEENVLRQEDQFISDDKTTDALIAAWREKLQSAVQDWTLLTEPEIHALLHTWQQLGVPNHQQLWQLTQRLCSTNDGLERFVGALADGSETWHWPSSFASFLHLVWDHEELATCLKRPGFAGRFNHLAERLRSKEAMEFHTKLRDGTDGGNMDSPP